MVHLYSLQIAEELHLPLLSLLLLSIFLHHDALQGMLHRRALVHELALHDVEHFQPLVGRLHGGLGTGVALQDAYHLVGLLLAVVPRLLGRVLVGWLNVGVRCVLEDALDVEGAIAAELAITGSSGVSLLRPIWLPLLAAAELQSTYLWLPAAEVQIDQLIRVTRLSLLQLPPQLARAHPPPGWLTMHRLPPNSLDHGQLRVAARQLKVDRVGLLLVAGIRLRVDGGLRAAGVQD